MAERTRGYALRFEVAARPEVVWQMLTDQKQIGRWHLQGMDVDARPGGSYRIRLDGDLEREAHIDLFQPPNRLRLVYMRQKELGEYDSVLVDDFLIDSPDGKTSRICVMGSGFQHSYEVAGFFQRVQASWNQSLNRLKVVAENWGLAGAADPGD